MKKIAAALITILSVLLPLFYAAPVCGAAVAGYGRALNDGIVMYGDTSLTADSALFTLTKSYYVYIFDINTADSYYTVEYQQNFGGYQNITGFIKKSDIKVWQAPNAPYYPDISATVANSTNLYRRPDSSSDNLVFIPKGSQVLKLYGSLFNEEENALYYFVIYFGGRDGYIPAANLDITLPAMHADPMPTPTPTPTPSPANSMETQKPLILPEGRDNLVQILLIAAICIPALIIVYLMFRPSKKSAKKYRQYYSEDDEDDNS